MVNNWKNCKIRDICSNVTSGGTPKSTKSEYYNGGNIPWLNTKEVCFNRIYHTEKYITEIGLKNSPAKWIKKNNIIVAMYGATAGNIAVNKIPLTTNQACCNLEINEKVADYRFVYYSLFNRHKILSSMANGGAQQNLNSLQIKDFEISLPTINIQQKIAKVLGALDDKIELNNKINENLELQAQSIFKSWFVDNRYEVEKETCIGELCKCELGGTPSRVKSEYWNGNIPWINSGAVNNYRITKPSEYITELGLSKSATKLLPAKTTVLAITGATLGQISLLEIASCANQSVVGIIENEKLPYEFIYPYICHNIKEILSHQTGGAQQHINKQNIEQLKINLPKSNIINKYKAIAKPMYENIAYNCFENEALTQLRDTLLPKLMNGEIDVENIPTSAIIPNK